MLVILLFINFLLCGKKSSVCRWQTFGKLDPKEIYLALAFKLSFVSYYFETSMTDIGTLHYLNVPSQSRHSNITYLNFKWNAH